MAYSSAGSVFLGGIAISQAFGAPLYRSCGGVGLCPRCRMRLPREAPPCHNAKAMAAPLALPKENEEPMPRTFPAMLRGLLGLTLLIASAATAWAAPEMTADEIFAKSQAVMAAPIQYRMVMGEVESIVSMKDLAGEIGVASRVEMVNPVIEQTTITTAKYAYEWPPNTGRSQDLEA